MPFDGRTYTEVVNEDVAAIDRVIALFPDGSRWCKGQLRSSTKRCIVGALHDADAAHLRPAIEKVLGGGIPIEGYNDHPDTTFSDVRRLLLRTRQILVGGKAPPCPRNQPWRNELAAEIMHSYQAKALYAWHGSYMNLKPMPVYAAFVAEMESVS